MSYTNFTVIGHVGRDPRFSEYNGNKVANFRLASTRRWNDANGNLQEETTWYSVSAWDNERGQKLATLVANSVTKGSQLLIDFDLMPAKNGGPRIYGVEVDDGMGGKKKVARADYEIRANVIRLLDRTPEGSRNGRTSDEVTFDQETQEAQLDAMMGPAQPAQAPTQEAVPAGAGFQPVATNGQQRRSF